MHTADWQHMDDWSIRWRVKLGDTFEIHNGLLTSSSSHCSCITFKTAFIFTHLALLMYLRAYKPLDCLCCTTQTWDQACRQWICSTGINKRNPYLSKSSHPILLSKWKWKSVASPSKSTGWKTIVRMAIHTIVGICSPLPLVYNTKCPSCCLVVGIIWVRGTKEKGKWGQCKAEEWMMRLSN